MEKIIGLIALSLGKKATVYALGRYYGFPRMYRRFVEFNRRVSSNKHAIRRRQEIMKTFFRLPNRLIALFRFNRIAMLGIDYFDNLEHYCFEKYDI